MRLVKLMKGDLWLESELGKGATFFFSIWLGLSPSEETGVTGFTPGFPYGTTSDGPLMLKILVAEDNAITKLLQSGF